MHRGYILLTEWTGHIYYIVDYYKESLVSVIQNTLGLSITVNGVCREHSLICLKKEEAKIKTGLEFLLSLTKTNDDGVHNRSCSIDWDENTFINASAITGALPIKAYQ